MPLYACNADKDNGENCLMRFLQGIAIGTPFSFTLVFSRDFCPASKVGKGYMSIVWYTELKGEVSQVEAMVNRSVLSRLLLLSIR